jgi:hypothetical protein
MFFEKLFVYQGIHSGKAFFEFLDQFSHLKHQILTVIYCMPRIFGSFFFPNLRDLETRLGGCRTRVIYDLFFKYFGR